MKNKNWKWTTKEGRKIKLQDMDDNHLSNAYLMIRRSEDNVIRMIFEYGRKAFEHEGDMTINAACRTAVDTIYDRFDERLTRLTKELYRRDLDRVIGWIEIAPHTIGHIDLSVEMSSDFLFKR